MPTSRGRSTPIAVGPAAGHDPRSRVRLHVEQPGAALAGAEHLGHTPLAATLPRVRAPARPSARTDPADRSSAQAHAANRSRPRIHTATTARSRTRSDAPARPRPCVGSASPATATCAG